MEKLQPLITHKFWVLFGLSLLMPLITWWMYNGSINETITTRRDAVTKAFKSATDPAKKTAPNSEWSKAANLYNEKHEKDFQEASIDLWRRQQDKGAMFWPPAMWPHVKSLPYGGGDPSNEVALSVYWREYEDQHQRNLRKVKPYQDGNGLVEINKSNIHRVPQGTWSSRRLPLWEEIWHAQEDEWLLSQMLTSINEVNKGASTIGNARVRQLHELKFMGGNLDEKDAGKKKAAGGRGRGGVREGPQAAGTGGGGGAAAGAAVSLGNNAGRRPAAGASAIKGGDLKFDPKKEFGEPVGKAPAKNSGRGRNALAGSKGTVPRRYVNMAENMPYRTRGFVMRLTMEQDALPLLLAELTNSRWPIEIKRVHWEAANIGRTASPIGSHGSQSSSAAASSSSGSRFGAPMAFGTGGARTGGTAARPARKTGEQTPLEAALDDPYLANVVIGGLITLFNGPDEEALAELQKQHENSYPEEGADETPKADDGQKADQKSAKPAGDKKDDKAADNDDKASESEPAAAADDGKSPDPPPADPDPAKKAGT